MGKAKAKGKSKGKRTAKGSRLTLVDKVGKRPFYSVERSRNQVLCRTGLGGPNSTFKFAYGPKHATCKTEAAAMTLAK